MNKLIEEFLNSQGNDTASNISSQLGVDSDKVKSMLPDIVPTILGGLNKNLQGKDKNSALEGIMSSFSGGDLMESVGGMLGGKIDTDKSSSSLLDNLFGGAKSNIISSLAEKFNLDGGSITKIVAMVIPFFMNFMSSKAGDSGVGGIASMIDADGDGNIIDDIGGLLPGGKGKDKGIAGALGDLF